MTYHISLEEVLKFLSSHKFNLSETRIKDIFYIIENLKLNKITENKKYVSCKTHEFDVEPDAFNDLCKICQSVYKRELDISDEKKINSTFSIVCNDFETRKISLKPRISFYIVALDKLLF